MDALVGLLTVRPPSAGAHDLTGARAVLGPLNGRTARQARRSNRSSSITLTQAATKSVRNFSSPSPQA